MGIFKNLLLGAAGLKTYQNVYNKPTVIPPPGYVIKGMEQVRSRQHLENKVLKIQ